MVIQECFTLRRYCPEGCGPFDYSPAGCPKCGAKVCPDCGEAAHPGQSCNEAEARAVRG